MRCCPPVRTSAPHRGRTLARLALRALLAAASLGPIAATAAAQQLNLKPRYVPKPGDGRHTLQLISRLETRSAAIAGEIAALSSDDPARPRAEIMACLTHLAHDLLRRGEDLGPEGSMLVIAGATLADDLPSLEAWLTPQRFDSRAASIAADLRAAANNDAASLPSETQELFRVLRDRLAPLVSAAAMPEPLATSPWWPAAAAPPPAAAAHANLTDLARAQRLDDAALTSAIKLDALLADAALHPSFAPSAAQITRAAEQVGQLLRSPPKWLARDLAPLNSQLATSLNELSDRSSSATGLMRLRRLALFARAAQSTAALRDSAVLRKLSDALLRAAATLPDPPSASELLRWRTLADALAAAATPPAQRADLERSLRPALPSLAAAVDESRLTLLASLPRLIEAQGVTTDPGIVSAVAAHRRRLADIDMLADLSAALADPDDQPAPRPGVRPAADPKSIVRAHLLKLSQGLSRPQTRDIALGSLRELAGEMSILQPLPREAALRGPASSPARDAAAESLAPLLALIDQTRANWMTEASKALLAGKPLESTSPALLAAIDTFLCASAAVSPSCLQRLGAWPPVHLSPADAAELASPLRAPLEACVQALRDASPSQFIAAARQLRAHPAALALGTTALRAPLPPLAAQSPVQPAVMDTLPPSLSKLALGGPDPDTAWLAAHVDQVALLCRYAQELPGADRARRENLRSYLDARARPLLSALD